MTSRTTHNTDKPGTDGSRWWPIEWCSGQS